MKCQIFAYFCLVLHKQKLVKQNLWSNEKTKRNQTILPTEGKATYMCMCVYIYNHIYTCTDTHTDTHTLYTCRTHHQISTMLASKPSSKIGFGLLARLKNSNIYINILALMRTRSLSLYFSKTKPIDTSLTSRIL